MRLNSIFLSLLLFGCISPIQLYGQVAIPSKPALKPINLSGIWWVLQTFPGGHNFIQISIHQKNGEVRACSVVPTAVAPGKLKYVEGSMCWAGPYDGVRSSFSTKAQFPVDPKLENTDVVFVDDENHIHNKVGGGIPLIRGSNALECKFDRDTHVSMDYAFFRALTASADLNDYKEASCWLNGLSEGGDPQAQALLASVLYQGSDDVPKDPKRAYYWAEKSASKGNYFGALVLATLYKEGQGVAPDLQKANFWLGMANEWRGVQILNGLGDAKTPWGLTPKELFGAAANFAQSIDDELGYCSTHANDPRCPAKFRHSDSENWIDAH
jgi:hypothetical protein